MDAARNEAVARAFRRRTREQRRFNLEKAKLVERLANLKDDAVPQLDVAVQLRAAQVEIAVAQTRFLSRRGLFLNLKRRCLRVIQNVQPGREHFHFARRNFRICFQPPDNASFYGHYELRAQLFGLAMRLSGLLLVEYNLREASPVAQIDEDQLAQIAPPLHPAHEHSVFVRVRRAEIAAVLRSLQVPESIKHLNLFVLTPDIPAIRFRSAFAGRRPQGASV